MVSTKKLANAVGGKTARACDNCIIKRARWYCTADDAFLCQACDLSVHSANPLARRHERVRLKISSFKSSSDESSSENLVPSWHKGFTKKARTPRTGKQSKKSKFDKSIQNSLSLVPELGGGEVSNEENEEQLLYRVPILDPFKTELCNSNEGVTSYCKDNHTNNDVGSESKCMLGDFGHLPSETELAEFAADVESLLGKGLDEESFDMEGLGLVDCKKEESMNGGRVKVENDEEEEGNHVFDTEIDMARESFELSFDYEEEENYKVGDGGRVMEMEESEKGKIGQVKMKKEKLLRLDYGGVITAWANQRCPWTCGDRPEIDPTDCWPHCMGVCGTLHHPYGDLGLISGHAAMGGDGGREARVSRYREKRRTRLFSKKIRYEVRKLNAEKRPRMKGRFVKRANFAGPAFPLLKK